MLSSNALKRDLITRPSAYRGMVLLSLYCFPLVLLVIIFKGNIVYVLSFISFCFAVYAARLESIKTISFNINECGEITIHDVVLAVVEGKITQRSFYNGLFLFIHIAHKKGLIEENNKRSSRLVIFSDALNESDYRLIARLINHTNHTA